MNVENMKKLIGQLERLPDKQFYMGTWIKHRECGTVACVAGWCALLNNGPKEGDTQDFAQDFLGLTEKEGDRLFFGKWINFDENDIPLWDGVAGAKDWSEITRQEAIDYMKEMIANA